MIYMIIVLVVLALPSMAFAWGPMTHIYLGNEIFSFAPLLPAGILALIRKYRQDFLYGNLMADTILGKKYLPDDKSSHSWEMAFNLLDYAKTGPEKAFVYGYLCHLAADTVAHETLTEDLKDVGHTWLELKADSVIDKVYWLQYVTMNRQMKKKHERFLEESVESYIFSFKTNKRIYKGIVFLSLLNKKRKRGIDKEHIERLHGESILRMVDLLSNGKKSDVAERSPL
ncbi:MAG TPA: zinc dependent phospholipase C family protein [Dissulfurispiraceae bacterium]|nr:zinc dependent phospholipase C family protein [Dissulfurispiraceae bacterium]